MVTNMDSNFSEKPHVAADYFTNMSQLTQRDLLWKIAKQFGERGAITAKTVIQLEEANTKEPHEQKEYIANILKTVEERFLTSKDKEKPISSHGNGHQSHQQEQEKPMTLLF